MDRIIIELLSHPDHEGPGYKAACKFAGQQITYKCVSYDDFKTVVGALHYLQNDTIITIFSHGYKDRGFSPGSWEGFVAWGELLLIADSIRGERRVILNLVALCESHHIKDMWKFCNHSIAEIWISNSRVMSPNKAILAADSENFYTFLGYLDQEEKGLYSNLELTAKY